MNIVRMAPAFVMASLLLGGCVTNGVSAAGQLFQAASLTDDDLARDSAKGVVQMDAQNRVAAPQSAYSKRLAKLTKTYTDVNGRPLQFKVYITPDINAFATPDGSVRVFSGLMDKMSDDELKFVIGHEIGHVALGHSKQKFQVAYTASAARQAAAGAGGVAGQIASSQLGGLMEAVVNAQFSQTEETAADEYGMDIAMKAHAKSDAAVSALQKLANGQSASGFKQVLSSHPDPMARAEHLRDRATKLASTTTP